MSCVTVVSDVRATLRVRVILLGKIVLRVSILTTGASVTSISARM